MFTMTTTKKLKNTRRLIFYDVRYTTVLKNDPSYFCTACAIMAKAVSIDIREYDRNERNYISPII